MSEVDQPAGAPTDAFRRFVDSVEGHLRPGVDPAKYRESVDVEALESLKGDERFKGEELLIDHVKNTDDWRAPPALAEIRLKRSVRPMKARLPTAKGRMKLALARALVALDALDSMDGTVVEMLDGGDPDEGVSAMAASPGLDSKEMVKALARASLYHPSREVRVNAGMSLLYRARLSPDPLMWEFRPLYLQLGEEDAKTRRDAFDAICQLTGMPPSFADPA